ncbi:MAG: tryptophan--tRNA ligase, partial [Syntrophorhabdaceae bacterium]|nr:tryptophan--tRNA ligase [Syntrophorhabdaceae bacterium]
MRKRVLSGMRPSGKLHLGHYIGVLANWRKLQEEHDCFFFVADWHALTTEYDNTSVIRESIDDMLIDWMASGIDPSKATLFVQSHVPEHAQLAWVLNCYAMFGELSRMTQFKDKSKQNSDNINAGLFTYPALMAADILIYNANLVPVGADQKQHLELARDIAVRFNSVYGDVFTVPEPYISKEKSARVMSLQEPEKKMSKSDSNANANILIMDKKDDIIKKF